MPMTPDEVDILVAALDDCQDLVRKFARLRHPQMDRSYFGEIELLKHLSTAISLIQDYQKLREICIKPNDGICYVCGKKTDSLTGNPSEWAIYLAHIDGQTKHRYYHIKCLYPFLQQPTEH